MVDRESLRSSHSLRLYAQGLAFLLVLALLLGLSVAVYQKDFSSDALLTLRTSTVGSQLSVGSDVKVRGVIVGEVRAVSPARSGATLTLAVSPAYLSHIPRNVTAQLLPKTLFGERYVALSPPDSPQGHLAAGDVIEEDHSQSAIELQKVIDDLLPLLKAVAPQDLAFTLGALADALRGRGDALGANLASLGQYMKGLNAVLPSLQADFTKLANVSDTYAAASPDLLGVLSDLSVSSTTLVDQATQLRRTFTTVASSSDTLTSFLTSNAPNLISLAKTSRPVLSTFARYSPEYPCLLNGLARFQPMITSAFGGQSPALQLNITVSFPPRNPYTPGDQPSYSANSGPDCRGLNNIDALIQGAAQGHYYCPATIPDGTHSPASATPTSCSPSPTSSTSSSPTLAPAALTSPVGSRSELDFVKSILAYQAGSSPTRVSDLSAATMAPLLRGTEVLLS